jgi:hypothetical protein
MRDINVDIIHEELFNEKPLLAFSPDNDYLSWKEQIRQKYIELLGLDVIAKNECPMDIQIEEIVDEEEYVRIRYTFLSEKNSYVPAYLLVPKTNKDKYPICICLQGHTTGFHISIGKKKYEGDERSLETSTFALDAVKHGYAALAIEQRGMGIRTTPRNDRGRALTCGCYHTAFTALLLGRTLIGERVWDVHKGIDSLEHFKDKLDLDDITLLGHSGGGTATYYSACYDTRIKYAMPCCSVCTYEDSILELWHCSCNYIPKIARFMDMGELATLIAPRKLLIINGEIDPIFKINGTRKVYSVVEQIYRKEGVPNNCKLVVLPGREHYFDKDVAFSELKKMRNTK